ncbi:MAG TPA: LysR substrate-binding domain-containing protein, partial [Ktedonobacteraceae bacterium]
TMDLRHLRYFHAVAQHQNFSRAAEELHLAQPSLSQQIQQLEHELGVVLFDRSRRQIELTQAGHEFFQHVRRLLEDVDDMREAVREVAGAQRGKVVLGVNPSSAGLLVPQIARSMYARMPGVSLIIHEKDSSSLVNMVIERKIDLGLGRVPLLKDNPKVALIEAQHLYQEQAHLVVSVNHPLARHTGEVRMAQLRDEPFLLRGHSTFYQQVLQACAVAGYIPHVVCEGAEIATLLRLVAAGIGITIVPAYGLKLMPHLQAQLVSLPIHSEESLTTNISLLWQRERYRSSTIHIMISLINEVVQSLVHSF